MASSAASVRNILKSLSKVSASASRQRGLSVLATTKTARTNLTSVAPSVTSGTIAPRWFSSTGTDQGDGFVAHAPKVFTIDMAMAIHDMTQLYIEYGVSKQRLEALAAIEMPVVQKWQQMMEIFFTTQLHVVAGFGYSPDEHGLMSYIKDFSQFLEKLDNDEHQIVMKVTRRETWRSLVATTFKVSVDDIPEMTIVDARNHMHKVTSKMQSPDILMLIQKQVSRIVYPENKDQETAMKHQALQDIIVNSVYLGDSPNSIVEQAKCGSGAEGYAKFQCALGDFEGDPLIGEYTMSAMNKMFEAGGLEGAGIMQQGQQPR
eukprot:CAMPEP_0198143002 /NCGR_PEP_ID=MMETSP1443-20131203/5646_1 /TAXON_ID=186043 /ORGANISM="Entomoneis sp., Strain CCMP2396" /LENGTH=317 /DNA_ID=CAMNT_0043806139 /DNA_START=98 /DNA_END=1048 /DNA_ORIENTATION=+